MEDSLRSQGKSLKLFPETFVVLQCAPELLPKLSHETLEGKTKLSFLSISVSSEECSVIAPENSLSDLLKGKTKEEEEMKSGTAYNNPMILKVDKDWRCFQVEGPLDFSLVGILHRILDPLKKAGISVLAVGTFNTDYFLVKQKDVERAKDALTLNEFRIEESA